MDLPTEVIEAVKAEPAPPPAKPVHVMSDLETWGTSNKAVPVSLGACKFNDTEILDQFHVGIDPRSCQQFGLEIDADTIMWWMDPERDAARVEWLKLQKVDLGSALMGFAEWCGTGEPVTALWGNGSTFDNIILRSAFEAVGLEYPVRFWQDQCYRTIKNRTPQIKLERVGTHHNALDDAISQAKHLQAIIAATGAPLKHIEEMTDAMRDYLDPENVAANRDEKFINQIIEFLDGPTQRERITAAAELVL